MAKIVRVTWTDPSPTTNVDHLEIWRSINSGAFAKVGANLTLGVETYDDDNGGPGFSDADDIDYSVRAYNASGQYSEVTGNIIISSSAVLSALNLDVDGTYPVIENSPGVFTGAVSGNTLGSISWQSEVWTGDFTWEKLFEDIETYEGWGLDAAQDFGNFQSVDYLWYGGGSFKKNNGTTTMVPGNVAAGVSQGPGNKVRLRRTGSDLYYEFWNGSTWSLVHSEAGVTANLRPIILLSDGVQTDGHQVSPSFPNYTDATMTGLANMTQSGTNYTSSSSIGTSTGAYSTTAALVGDFRYRATVGAVGDNQKTLIGVQTAQSVNFTTNVYSFYVNNTQADIKSAGSSLTLDNPQSITWGFNNYIIIERIGSTFKFYTTNNGVETLVHTITGATTADLYLQLTCLVVGDWVQRPEYTLL